MTDQQADLLRIAYHESGHLVAAACWGREIIAVSIDPKGRGAQVNLWPSARHAESIRQTLVILAAGPIAAMFHNPSADPDDRSDASQLIETGWALVGRLAPAEMHHAELQAADRRAARLIARNWGHVERVAQSLLSNYQIVVRGPRVECVGDLDGE